jgi:RNA-directed DNA polymerase
LCLLLSYDFKWIKSSKDRRGKWTTITLIRLSSVTIQRYVKVKGTASPDNPQLTEYWQHRQTQYGKTYWGKGSKLYRVAVNQLWRCPICCEHLFNGEPLHTIISYPLPREVQMSRKTSSTYTSPATFTCIIK